MIHLNFARDQWNTDDMTYAYTYRFNETPVFTQQDDCVENKRCSDNKYGFEQITMLTKEKHRAGIRISSKCSFDKYGAPLFMLTDQLTKDENGNMRFGDYFEVVLYERGVNVWFLHREDGEVKVQNLLRVEFPITAAEIHTLTTEIKEKTFVIYADEHKIQLHVPNLFESFHIGITACEGINHFYTLDLEKIEA